MEIRLDHLAHPDVIALLREHLRCMAVASPPESIHALDLDGLKKPGVTFWTAWDGDRLVGCGALKELDAAHGEIKSMRTDYAYQRRGVARQMLQHLVDHARERGYTRLSLETGSMEYFEPARQLYARFGFKFCGPFGLYVEDPNSRFMTLKLE